ncbi:MAG: histidine kinase [Planctomycetes bacterium]|nr:histidine kinase [Planctomycetota bacterium]
MTDIISLGDDLLFFSRIRAEAEAAGRKAWQARDLASLRARLADLSVGLVLLDLDVAEAGAVISACPAGVSVVAYGPHVDAARLRSAREAGCARVMPRSQFVAELSGIVSAEKSC